LGLTSAEAARVGVLVEVQRRRTRVHRTRVCALGMAWACFEVLAMEIGDDQHAETQRQDLFHPAGQWKMSSG